MYSIDQLCPSGQPIGGYGFAIHLHPDYHAAVKASGYTQEHANMAVKAFGLEWLQKCGFNNYFDPENTGFGANKAAIPSAETKPSYSHREIRITWGEWGIEHISVPGNACGLDISRGMGNPFEGGRSLTPHNIDSWSQVMLLLVAFTWLTNSVLISARCAESEKK